MTPTSKVTALLLALSAASPTCDSLAFAPGPRLARQQQRRCVSVGLSSSNRDDEYGNAADGRRKASGSAAAFLTGMGIMVQLAFADPTALVAPIDAGEATI
jgi:hypothetical protein